MFGAKPATNLSISTSAANNPFSPYDRPATGAKRRPEHLKLAYKSTHGFCEEEEVPSPGKMKLSTPFLPFDTTMSISTTDVRPAHRTSANTTASSQTQPGIFGTANQTTSSGSNFGGMFGSLSTTQSQPQLGGSVFAQTTPQQSAPSLFGAKPATSQATSSIFSQPSTSQPTSSIFDQPSTSQPASNVFGQTPASQPSQSSSVFKRLNQNPTPSIFSGFGQTSQPSTTGSNLFPTTNSNSGFQQPGSTAPNHSVFSSNTLNPNPGGLAPPSFGSLNASTSTGAKIDLEHLRPTTKYDQLTDGLQSDIAALDTFILSQIQMAHEVADLLPAIAAAGGNLPQDVAFVSQKLEQVETGLENDAEEIIGLREGVVRKDAAEARVCFRNVDRLKMPQHYQTSAANGGITGGVYGGSGLSGWWNHPQTLQRSVRGANGADGSRSLTLSGDDDGDTSSGAPATLVDLFERRTTEMKTTLESHKELLEEIEAFVGSVETKILSKEREQLDDRADSGDQVSLLRYVFGAVERSLYDVADKVGGARDGVQELIMPAVDQKRMGSSRLGR